MLSLSLSHLFFFLPFIAHAINRLRQLGTKDGDGQDGHLYLRSTGNPFNGIIFYDLVEREKMMTTFYFFFFVCLGHIEQLICLSNLGQLMAGSAQFAFNRFYCPCGGRGRPIDCTRCCRRLPVRSIREQVESGTIVLSNIVTTPVAELPKEPTPAPNDQNNRGIHNDETNLLLTRELRNGSSWMKI